MTAPVWRRSSHCAAGDCIEAMDTGGPLGVVKLQRISGHFIWDDMTVERAEFAAFAKGIRDGEFDDLIGDSHE